MEKFNVTSNLIYSPEDMEALESQKIEIEKSGNSQLIVRVSLPSLFKIN